MFLLERKTLLEMKKADQARWEAPQDGDIFLMSALHHCIQMIGRFLYYFKL